MNVISEFVSMEKIGHRYVIQYFHLKCLSSTNSKAKLDSTLDDCRLKVCELADMVGISKSAVRRKLTENLDIRKLCAR